MNFKCISYGIIFCAILLGYTQDSFALSTDDLLRLKKAGVSEEVIVLIVEANYRDADRVLELKRGGFTNESIKAVVKADLGSDAVAKGVENDNASRSHAAAQNNAKTELPVAAPEEKISFQTSGKAKILWFMFYRGKPVLQNSAALDKVKIALVDNSSLKFVWEEDEGLGLLELLKTKPFKSPFYWTLNKDDTLESGEEGYAYKLKSTVQHKGQPENDGAHYWILYFDSQDPKLSQGIRENLDRIARN